MPEAIGGVLTEQAQVSPAPVKGDWPDRGEGTEAAAGLRLPPLTRSTFYADNEKPGAAKTARARHRRYQLPCTPDLTAALLALVAAMPARDRRHETAAAWRDLEDFADFLELEGKSARTQYAYVRAAAPLLRAHPDKRFDEFTSADVNGELRKIPARSRYISRSIYNRWFDWGLWDERIEKSPMTKVPRMSAGHRRDKGIFTDQEIAILEACPVPDGPLFTLLFRTGLRRGEARALRRQHIDLDRMRLMVYGGKGDKDRTIPFTVDVATAVADLDLVERLEPGDHLWYRRRYPPGDQRRRHDPIGDTTFETWYRDMIELAGVRYLNPHQTRHTYHSWLRRGGLDLEERQALLGHESPETTVRQYGRIEFEDLAAKVAAL